MRIILFLIAALGVAEIASAAERPLASMSFWAGHCFKGTFPDGKQTDEHCFAWVYEGLVLRDRHVVHAPGKPDYIGETVYYWDLEAKKIAYLYYENAGGTSRGTAEATVDGMIFPSASYVSPDDSMTYRARWTRLGSDAYEAFSEAQNGAQWMPMFKMVMKAQP